MLHVDTIIEAIANSQGQEFHTPSKGVAFTYAINGKRLDVSNTQYPINLKANVQKACDMLNEGLGWREIRKEVHGPSYIMALLTDSRITQGTKPTAVRSEPERDAGKIGKWYYAILQDASGLWKSNKVGARFTVRINGTKVEVKSGRGKAQIVETDVAKAHFVCTTVAA
jgi:hypothetical protein